MNIPVSAGYFTDENMLGLGKLLHRSGRADVLYPGHEGLPQVPRGAPDLEWMPIVGRLGLVVITRDRRIRSRPAELDAYWAHRIRSVWVGGKRDLRAQDQLELFTRYERRLLHEIVVRGAGPWALSLTPTRGLREIRLRPPPAH